MIERIGISPQVYRDNAIVGNSNLNSLTFVFAFRRSMNRWTVSPTGSLQNWRFFLNTYETSLNVYILEGLLSKYDAISFLAISKRVFAIMLCIYT